MKFILPVVSLIALSFPVLAAAEESRDWTDIKGRTITGTLVAKSKTSATINLASTGKNVEIPVENLSEESLDYVAKAKLHRIPRFRAITSTAKSNAAKTRDDERAVRVTVSDIGTRACSAWIVWLGDGVGSGKFGVWKVGKAAIEKDGESELTVAYTENTDTHYGKNYRGWACGLRDDETGEWLAKSASMNGYLKFLTEDLKESKK